MSIQPRFTGLTLRIHDINVGREGIDDYQYTPVMTPIPSNRDRDSYLSISLDTMPFGNITFEMNRTTRLGTSERIKELSERLKKAPETFESIYRDLVSALKQGLDDLEIDKPTANLHMHMPGHFSNKELFDRTRHTFASIVENSTPEEPSNGRVEWKADFSDIKQDESF